MIEAEIRSFVSEDKFSELLDFFKKNAKEQKEDYQETYYFKSPTDVRIQKNKFFSKIWMKKGKVHDESREEIEVKFPIDDFKKIEAIFKEMGHDVYIKWFRDRISFKYRDFDICLDKTKGYGNILEIERLCEDSEKEKALEEIKIFFRKLGVDITPREEFERKFSDYKTNWQTLTGETNL